MNAIRPAVPVAAACDTVPTGAGALTSTAAAFRARSLRRFAGLGAACLALFAAFLLDLSVGPGRWGAAELLPVLLDPSPAPPALRVVVWDIRLPVALMALVVGAMLGLAGAAMQTILGNPLADPFTLGLSAAAGVGAALAIAFGWSLLPGAGPYLVSFNAFLMALLASSLLFGLTRLRGVTAETMILVGIALLFSFNAILALIQYRSNEQQLQQIVFWTMGSLGRATWPRLGLAAAVLAVCVPLLLRRAWALTALTLGEARAAAFGVRVDRLRLEMLVIVSALAAVAVSLVGTIGFIGLVGPHIARLAWGDDQRLLLPGSALASAILLSLASTASKAITPGVIYPIGIVTALIGVPFFAALVLRIRGKSA